jgi:hypothetical protein
MILLGIIFAFLLYIQRENRKNQIPSKVPQETTHATGFLGGADQI